MELRDYLRTLRLHWRSIIACALIATGVAGAVSLATTPTYRSTATLFVSTPGGETGGVAGAYTGNLFTQQRVRSYVQFIDSPTVTSDVVDRLDLDMSPEAVSSMVEADAPLDTSLINISATDTSPERAQQLAQGVTESFSSLAAELEGGDVGTATITLTVVRPAELPGAPVAPRTRLNLALGLLVGLAVGVAYAVAKETLDTRVKNVEALGTVSHAPNLATIALDEKAGATPLIVNEDPRSPRSEAYRQLRTNLQFVDVDTPPRSIVVTSAVSGEGKSTTSANLAIALAQAGTPVLLLDADLRRPKVGEYLGIESAVGITDVLVGRVAFEEAVQTWGPSGNLHVLPSGAIPPNPSELLGSGQMRHLLERLSQRYLVVLDAPPLLPVTDAAVLASMCSGALLVVRARSTKREAVAQAVENLRAVDARLFGTVLNMAPTRGPDAYAYTYGYGYGYAATPPRSGRRAKAAVKEPASRSV